MVVFKEEEIFNQPMVLSESAVAPYAGLAGLDPAFTTSLANKVEIMQSYTVLNRVIAKLGLTDWSLAYLSDQFTIEPIKGTSSIRVKAQASSAKQAETTANAVVSEGIDLLKEIRLKEVQNARNFITNQLEMVSNTLSELHSQSIGTVSAIEQKELDREIAVNEELYIILSQKRLEMQVLESKRLDDVEWLQQAVASEKPIKPNKALNIIIAAFLAFFAGVFWVFLEQAWANRRQTGAISS